MIVCVFFNVTDIIVHSFVFACICVHIMHMFVNIFYVCAYDQRGKKYSLRPKNTQRKLRWLNVLKSKN